VCACDFGELRLVLGTGGEFTTREQGGDKITTGFLSLAASDRSRIGAPTSKSCSSRASGGPVTIASDVGMPP